MEPSGSHRQGDRSVHHTLEPGRRDDVRSGQPCIVFLSSRKTGSEKQESIFSFPQNLEIFRGEGNTVTLPLLKDGET